MYGYMIQGYNVIRDLKRYERRTMCHMNTAKYWNRDYCKKTLLSNDRLKLICKGILCIARINHTNLRSFYTSIFVLTNRLGKEDTTHSHRTYITFSACTTKEAYDLLKGLGGKETATFGTSNIKIE